MKHRAKVVGFHRERDVTTTVIVCAEPPSPPVAPASLVDDSTDWVAVIELHRLVDESGPELRFETYGPVEDEPVVGREYTLQLWWTREAYDLVADVQRTWTLEPYPADADDCVYCPLTYHVVRPGRVEGFGDGGLSIARRLDYGGRVRAIHTR
jgi:hypothetical protein